MRLMAEREPCHDAVRGGWRAINGALKASSSAGRNAETALKAKRRFEAITLKASLKADDRVKCLCVECLAQRAPVNLEVGGLFEDLESRPESVRKLG